MNSSVKAEPALHLFQQIEDLGADGNVERGDRLVADDELRIENERARDADALALPAGEFMRQPSHDQGRIEPDRGEHLVDEPLALLRILDARNHQRLGDDVADLAARVERGDRILEDQLHAPAHQPQGIALHRREIVTVEQNAPRGRPAQLQHRPAQRRFSAAGFADQTQRFAAGDLQGHAGHGMNDLGADGIFDDEIVDVEQRVR